MKILLSNYTLFGFPLEETFLMAAETGCDGVELLIGFSRASRDEKEIKRLVKRYGLPVLAIHQPVWHWPRVSRGMLGRLARFADRVGAGTIIVHLSVLRFHPRNIFEFTHSLEQIHGVTIAFENCQAGSIERPSRRAWAAEELGRLIDEHKTHLALDLPKFVLANGADRDFLAYRAPAFAAIHLHGSQEGRVHRSLAQSDENYLSLLADFYSQGAEAPVTLEVFPLEWLDKSGLNRNEIRDNIASIIARDVRLVRKAC